jgi:hypothetical protein
MKGKPSSDAFWSNVLRISAALHTSTNSPG